MVMERKFVKIIFSCESIEKKMIFLKFFLKYFEYLICHSVTKNLLSIYIIYIK